MQMYLFSSEDFSDTCFRDSEIKPENFFQRRSHHTPLQNIIYWPKVCDSHLKT